jgi:predicted TIM-barrel fold metal-dependent hydrolase
MEMTNCHMHTFTNVHVPDRYVPRIVGRLLRIAWFRDGLLMLVRLFDRGRRTRLARYARILEVSYDRSQEAVFLIARGFYPRGTRFVVLAMDMAYTGAGEVEEPLSEQHAALAQLAKDYPEVVIPFAAVDPRRPRVVEETKRLLEHEGFRGIKLYPPTGYHPNDPRLRDLYAYAAQHAIPVVTHCSRPAHVQYRGEPTEEMRKDPVTGERLDLGPYELLTLFTDPESYVPILERHRGLKLCLAHFGGEADWDRYLREPWQPETANGRKSWLAKIVDMILSGKYENLYTDISYVLFVDDDYVHMLKVLLSDARIAERVLFGSDFYVVENAKLDERRIAVRLRSVLGEELFDTIARVNPARFLA